MRQFMCALIATMLVMAAPTMAEEGTRRITVVGQGSVEAVPDMATVSMGVISEAKTGAGAMTLNSTTLADVMAQLKAAGIEARDVQTSNLSLSPRWDNKSSSRGEGQKIGGFVASNTVTVRVRDLSVLGEVLDAVVQSGANRFNGLHFGLQEPQPVQDAARKVAVADARRKAELYAVAAGVTLGDVLTISEVAQNGGGPVMMAMGAEMAQSRAVPVSQGELSVATSVSVIYAIAD